MPEQPPEAPPAHTEVVSVIVPVYNRAALLAETLDSIRAQTWRPLELVIVDDGSTDDSLTAVEDWKAKNDGDGFKVKVVSQKNAGASAARNTGVKNAAGRFVCFVDSDDLLNPDGVETCMQVLLAKPDLDFVYSSVVVADEKGQVDPKNRIGQIYAPGLPLRYDWHTMAAVYRRKVFDTAGLWNETLRNATDLDMHSRIKLHGLRGRFIEGTMGVYRQHAGERLIERRFNPKHVRSACDACLNIAKVARQERKLNPGLGHRISRRLLVHALEFGAAGMREERNRVIDAALALPQQGKALPLALRLLRRWPLSMPQGLLYSAIRRVNG